MVFNATIINNISVISWRSVLFLCNLAATGIKVYEFIAFDVRFFFHSRIKDMDQDEKRKIKEVLREKE